MNPSIKILFFFVDIALPLCAGYVLARRERPTARFYDRMMQAAILVVAPVLALLSCWAMELEAHLIWLPILGVAMQVLPGGIGWLLARGKPHDDLEKGSYVISTILSNRGIVGGLAVFILFGETAYAHSRLIVLLGMPVLYGFCFPLARYYHASHRNGQEEGSIWSIILHPNQVPMLGVAAGFALNFSAVARPEVMGGVFDALVHVIAWMLLVPVGYSIDFGEMREHWRHVLDILPLKFVITPLLLYALGRAVGLRGEVLATLVIIAASPTAINAVITSKLHNLNVHVSMAAFVLTTGVYLVLVYPVILGATLLWGGL